MRNSAGEKSELLEGFGFTALCFGALPGSDVAENEDDAGDFIFVVANRRRHLFNDVFAAVPRSQSDVLGEVEQNRLSLTAITALLHFRLCGKIDSHVKD